jgi:hypothetical protein
MVFVGDDMKRTEEVGVVGEKLFKGRICMAYYL